MLALRPWIALFTILLVPVLAGYLVLTSNGKPENIVIVTILGLVALILLRRAVFEPLLTVRHWRRLSQDMGLSFQGDLSHEPVVTGDFDGIRFVAGISAHQGQRGKKGRYRTLVSAPVFVGVPVGLRVYGAKLDEWSNDYSERRRVPTGNQQLEEHVRCEGAVPEEVREFVDRPGQKQRVLDFLERWPGMLIHGGESSQLPAEPGGASGVVTVAIEGRNNDRETVERCISEVCRMAQELNSPA